ncbi:type IX secretion system protein PorG [Anditalea andensis]|uniref:DUF6089 domain-containing protein n=1 Tax=Anditalea andensis TaxID=1048983 RepID=A0A074LHY9_9BACT|nr:DUF6089 family protein [Anditalea andensis]KEO73417.1 hypothetical protein EL17_13845 [Anditalea andensis]
MKKARFLNLCFGILFGSLLLLSMTDASAQQYEVGLGLGGATYTGDIIRHVDPTQIGIQGTLFGRRNFDNVWSVRGGLAFARLNGADEKRPIDAMAIQRDAYFQGSALEAHILAEYHFLDYLSPQSAFRFSPFAMFGLGYTFFSGRGNGGPEPDGRYSVGTPVIPIGAGVKYKLRDRLFMTVEAGIRATFTDYLDKIEHNTVYLERFIPDPDNPGMNMVNPAGLNYGSRDDKDWYYFLGVTLSYSFHQVKCFSY